MDMTYFLKLGYKTANPDHNQYIIKGFQDHAGLLVDGKVGPLTKAKMAYYNHKNFCPEVYQPIKPYQEYTDEQIESLCSRGLKGLGADFNKWSKKNDFDVLHNLAHAILESGWGDSAIAQAKNNIYGWRAYDHDPMNSANSFDNKGDCIKAWSEWWNKEYLLPTGNWWTGGASEFNVNQFYASSSVAGINKAFIVRTLLKNLAEPEPVLYLPESTVPGAKDFVFREGYSNIEVNGIRQYKVDPIPLGLIGNAIRVFQNLQLIRNFFGVPVIISFSGNLYRNPDYNVAAGGSDTSLHMKALAVDCRVVGVSSHDVYRWAKENTEFKGFGIISNTWIHMDLRSVPWYEVY
jgi:hypothetical protein